jgi:hypothetical protein
VHHKGQSFKIGERSFDEEEVLVALLERRRRLIEEAGARRLVTGHQTPVESIGEVEQQIEEDLIDMEDGSD